MQFKFLYLEEDVEEETALKKHNKNTQEVVFTASITKLLKGSSTWLRDRRGNITVACKVRSGMEKTSLWKQEAPNEPADSKLKKRATPTHLEQGNSMLQKTVGISINPQST